MSDKGINLGLFDAIEKNTTGVSPIAESSDAVEKNAREITPVLPTFPSGCQFIGVFLSLDQLKSCSSKNTVGELALIARDVEHEDRPPTVEYDEYVYTGSTYGWVKADFKSGKSLVLSMMKETVEDINRVQEIHDTSPSGWGYDNCVPANSTLAALKSKFGICISNGICDEFLSIGRTLNFLSAIKSHKKCKMLSASTIAAEIRKLAIFADEFYKNDEIPANVKNNINCHIWLLCVSALTAHMWWDERVVKILKEYEDVMVDVVAFSPKDNIITGRFVDRTAETIGQLIKLDPKCIGVHLNEVQLTKQSGWYLWWKQEHATIAAMQGKNLTIYRFKKYLGRYIRCAFRGLWTLLHD